LPTEHFVVDIGYLVVLGGGSFNCCSKKKTKKDFISLSMVVLGLLETIAINSATPFN
jgi:hypothetical protein